jgi:hypothetical protein
MASEPEKGDGRGEEDYVSVLNLLLIYSAFEPCVVWSSTLSVAADSRPSGKIGLPKAGHRYTIVLFLEG